MRSIIVSFFIFLVPTLAGAEVSSFVFTSASALPLNERHTITVQSQNGSSEKENVTSTTCLEIRTTSSAGKLFGSSNGTDPVSVLVLTMNKSSANRNFYYEDGTAGSYIFSLKAAYRPEEEKRTCSNWPLSEWGSAWSASQNYTVGTSGGSSNTGTENSSGSTGGTAGGSSSEELSQNSGSQIGSGIVLSPEPQVLAEIKAPKTVIVGAQFSVSGEGYGLEKKPLEKARFVWNFGDGTTKEGVSVGHTYRNIGQYALILDVSSGKFTGSARQAVSVVKSPLSISKVSPGTEGFIEIKNESTNELDLSGWIVDVSQHRFGIPRNTFILSKGTLVLDSVALGFAIDGSVSLLYPNGSPAVLFEEVKPVVKKSAPVVVSTPKNSSVAQSVPAESSKKITVAPRQNTALAAEALSSGDVISQVSLDEISTDSISSNSWWFIAFIALIVIASGSVFFIQKPKPNMADEFTIEE